MNLYSYAGNGPTSFSDPFGLCADEGGGADSVQVKVRILCPNGTQYDTTIWAHKVPDSDLPLVGAAAQKIQSTSSKVFTPTIIQEGYGAMTTQGGIYTFPTSIAGGTVAQGGFTVVGGGSGFVAFREDVWSGILSGNMHQGIGNRGFNVCSAVGHEGVHIQQQYSNLGVGTAASDSMREVEAYAVRFKC